MFPARSVTQNAMLCVKIDRLKFLVVIVQVAGMLLQLPLRLDPLVIPVPNNDKSDVKDIVNNQSDALYHSDLAVDDCV